MVLSDPLDGCGPVEPPPATTFHHRWFLLVGDGNCDSGDKVLSAQQAGYSAAVVFNTSGDGFCTSRGRLGGWPRGGGLLRPMAGFTSG